MPQPDMGMHRQYGAGDEPDAPIGDVGFVGVDARNAPERIGEGLVAAAVNKDFSRMFAAFSEFTQLPEALPLGVPRVHATAS